MDIPVFVLVRYFESDIENKLYLYDGRSLNNLIGNTLDYIKNKQHVYEFIPQSSYVITKYSRPKFKINLDNLKPETLAIVIKTHMVFIGNDQTSPIYVFKYYINNDSTMKRWAQTTQFKQFIPNPPRSGVQALFR
jgi:hypothetical protein